MRSGVFSNLEKNAGAFEAEIHQQKIDVVISAAAGLQRMRRALFLFQAQAHLLQLRAGASALAVAPPIDVLQLMQEQIRRAKLARRPRAISCR